MKIKIYDFVQITKPFNNMMNGEIGIVEEIRKNNGDLNIGVHWENFGGTFYYSEKMLIPE